MINYEKIWQEIIIGDDKALVCFSNGSCVVFTESQKDLRKSAVDLMKEWGPVYAGSSDDTSQCRPEG